MRDGGGGGGSDAGGGFASLTECSEVRDPQVN